MTNSLSIMNKKGGVSMRTAAIVAGLPVMLLTAPYGEFYVFGKLIIYHDAAQTTQNLLSHPKLFLSGIFAMLFTFLYDIVLKFFIQHLPSMALFVDEDKVFVDAPFLSFL
ncbi:MAG: DUF4386 family protein [Sediminibacterium sp.]